MTPAKRPPSSSSKSRRVTSKPAPVTLRAAVDELSAAERSTPEQRRAILIETMRAAVELLSSESTTDSTKATCVKEVRTIVAQLSAQDAELPVTSTAWGAGAPVEPE